jgi:hypothetical protein
VNFTIWKILNPLNGKAWLCMDICNRIDEPRAHGNAVWRFESANLIAPIVCRIAIFLMILPGICIAEEESMLPLPLGSYRLEMIMATVSRLPFFGSSKSASKSVSLVEVRRREPTWSKAIRCARFASSKIRP